MIQVPRIKYIRRHNERKSKVILTCSVSLNRYTFLELISIAHLAIATKEILVNEPNPNIDTIDRLLSELITNVEMYAPFGMTGGQSTL